MIVFSCFSADKPLHEYGLFSYGLWVSTIVGAAVNLVFGLVSVGFAIFNMCGKPIETITGPVGLYLWNGFACKLNIYITPNKVLFFSNIFLDSSLAWSYDLYLGNA